MRPPIRRISKVTAFPFDRLDPNLVLAIQHPDGGWQLIGGTAEHGESPDEAAIRECAEETGLALGNVRELWRAEHHLPPGEFILLAPAEGATEQVLGRGHRVRELGRESSSVLIEEVEYDLSRQPPAPLRRHAGRILDEHLATTIERTFFAGVVENARASWHRHADGRDFVLGWVDVRTPPDGLLEEHRNWLARATGLR